METDQGNYTSLEFTTVFHSHSRVSSCYVSLYLVDIWLNQLLPVSYHILSKGTNSFHTLTFARMVSTGEWHYLVHGLPFPHTDAADAEDTEQSQNQHTKTGDDAN